MSIKGCTHTTDDGTGRTVCGVSDIHNDRIVVIGFAAGREGTPVLLVERCREHPYERSTK